MRIDEIPAGLTGTVVAKMGNETVELTTIFRDPIPKKRMITADPIYKNERVISFKAKGLIVDLLVNPPDSPPLIFKNVTIVLMKREDQSLCYAISSITDSKALNRREAFRCFVGIPTAVQGGGNKAAHDAIIKDVSITGFSVTCDVSVEFHENQVLHVILNDYLEEIAENFNFHLYGLIVRVVELEGNKVLYGCRLNNKVPGLDQYITKKERLRIKKNMGR